MFLLHRDDSRRGLCSSLSSPPGLTRLRGPKPLARYDRAIAPAGEGPVVHADCVRGKLSANPIELPFRMDCRIKSGNDEGERTKKKGSGTPTDVFSQPPHLAMRRAPLSLSPPRVRGSVGGRALAYRRSTAALTVRAFGPWAQLQARLPGTWQDVRSGKLAPTGEQRPRVLTRALPAPACPSPGNAPPGPVVVPVSMMPEAARVRSVSFRSRAPHSLHLSEYLRDRRPR